MLVSGPTLLLVTALDSYCIWLHTNLRGTDYVHKVFSLTKLVLRFCPHRLLVAVDQFVPRVM